MVLRMPDMEESLCVSHDTKCSCDKVRDILVSDCWVTAVGDNDGSSDARLLLCSSGG